MSNSLQEGCRTSDLGYSTVELMSCQLLTIGEVWIVTCCCWPEPLNFGPFQKPSSLSTGNFAYTKRICRSQWDDELCHFNANTPTVTQCFVPLHASGGLSCADTLRAHVCSVLVPCKPLHVPSNKL